MSPSAPTRDQIAPGRDVAAMTRYSAADARDLAMAQLAVASKQDTSALV
jgi:hypothetical protein